MKQYSVATILINHSKEIYAAVDKVKTKADLPNVTKVVENVLNANNAAVRDKLAAYKCIEYLKIAEQKSIAAYTGTLVTYMGGGKI